MDPISALNVRYTKGEITQLEYTFDYAKPHLGETLWICSVTCIGANGRELSAWRTGHSKRFVKRSAAHALLNELDREEPPTRRSTWQKFLSDACDILEPELVEQGLGRWVRVARLLAQVK